VARGEGSKTADRRLQESAMVGGEKASEVQRKKLLDNSYIKLNVAFGEEKKMKRAQRKRLSCGPCTFPLATERNTNL